MLIGFYGVSWVPAETEIFVQTYRQPPDTGQNVSLDHEISQDVKTHLETKIPP